MPFTLPAHVEVSIETLHAIARRHGVEPFTAERLPGVPLDYQPALPLEAGTGGSRHA